MPRTYKKSNWKHGRLDTGEKIWLETEKLYPAPVMAEIIKAARLEKIQPDAAKRQELTESLKMAVIKLAVTVKNWSELKNRPSPAQRKATLLKVEQKAKELYNLLNTIDGDSLNDLLKEFNRDEFSKQVTFDGLTRSSNPRLLSYEKFDLIIKTIKMFKAWAQKAQKSTLAPKDGDRHADVKHWLCEATAEIWVYIGHEKPTITYRHDLPSPKATGAFLEFTNAIANPLGIDSLEASLRRAIKLWKNKPR